ncbi:hypothetical protein ABZ569_27410 [Streptomyces albus]|uniref:hypothetical protein n=1 Tax=Streptomyces albus TaxID=1888 RepID=UPI0033FC5FED
MDVVAYIPAGIGRLAVEGAPEPLGGEAEDPGGHAAQRVELVLVDAQLLRRADASEGGGRLVERVSSSNSGHGCVTHPGRTLDREGDHAA